MSENSPDEKQPFEHLQKRSTLLNIIPLVSFSFHFPLTWNVQRETTFDVSEICGCPRRNTLSLGTQMDKRRFEDTKYYLHGRIRYASHIIRKRTISKGVPSSALILPALVCTSCTLVRYTPSTSKSGVPLMSRSIVYIASET